MKLQNILKNRLVIYLLGISIGVLISFGSFSIYTSIKASAVESKVQTKVTDFKKVERFANLNKDYIAAGLLLSSENKGILDNEISEMSQEELKKTKTYIEMKIKPLYKEVAIDYFNNEFSDLDFSNFKNNLSSYISSKIKLLLPKLSSSIKEFLKSHINIDKEVLIDKIYDTVITYLNQNINFDNINFDKEEFIQKLKDSINDYLNDNINFNIDNFLNKIQEVILDYLNENVDIDTEEVLNNIKSIILDFLNDKIDLNVMLENIKDTILDFIINSSLAENIDNLIEKIHDLIGEINYLFSDIDNDYNFGEVVINGNKIDLSFLNIIDLYIDPMTAIYDNGGTILNLQDDSLIIKDVYINLEALNGRGIDIIIGQINVNGRLAYFIYQGLGVINGQI